MSTHFRDIEGALLTRLSVMPGVPSIAVENIDFKPDAGTLYFRTTLLPAPTVQASLGSSGMDVSEGILQVDIFIPDGQGKSPQADAVADWFKRGTVLTQNSLSVRIVSASIAPGFKDETFYIIPVEIRWQAYTVART